MDEKRYIDTHAISCMFFPIFSGRYHFMKEDMTFFGKRPVERKGGQLVVRDGISDIRKGYDRFNP